jgi:hypothetical protein
MKRVTFALLTFSLINPILGNTQTINQMAQSTINAAGEDCPSVTKVKALGTTPDKAAIFAAACSNGTRHVLKIPPQKNALDYVSTCDTFESLSKIKCFN